MRLTLVVGDEPTFDSVLCPDCSGVRDIFVHDRAPSANGIFDEGDGVTTRVSDSTAGDPANVNCTRPMISDDGRHVTFRSTASNLVVRDINGLQDIFVHDRLTSTTVRVSVNSAGQETFDGNSDILLFQGTVAMWRLEQCEQLGSRR